MARKIKEGIKQEIESSGMRVSDIIEKRLRLTAAEAQQTLNTQRVKLEQLRRKIGGRMEESKQEAKKSLERGDERGFRVASRKYIMTKNTCNSIDDLKEMAESMIDLAEMGEVLRDVVEAGGDLAKVQSKLGLDTSQLESSLAKIRTSMDHMGDIANVLTVTIESTLANPKELSTEQEVLRKELLVEIQAEAKEVTEKVEKEKLRERVEKE